MKKRRSQVDDRQVADRVLIESTFKMSLEQTACEGNYYERPTVRLFLQSAATNTMDGCRVKKKQRSETPRNQPLETTDEPRRRRGIDRPRVLACADRVLTFSFCTAQT